MSTILMLLKVKNLHARFMHNYIMGNLSFKAEYRDRKGNLTTGLSLYTFKEDNMTIVYCPALDMSACGNTVEEAKKDFSERFRLYLSYCMNKNTLIEDLQKHGWSVKSLKQRKMKAPTTKEMLDKNSTLKDIIYNKEYSKIEELVEMPELG
jgi:uncharacterized protein YajQ (UPF0234 family)